MGFGKKKRQIREAVAKWECFGYLGYGQGRAIAQFGEAELHGKSACLDVCSRATACRAQHHEKSNQRFPQLGQLVESTARLATARGLDVVTEVVSAMGTAAEMGLDEALTVKNTLNSFKVYTMTDHYRCGQFENIQDGLNKVPPGTHSKPDASLKAS